VADPLKETAFCAVAGNDELVAVSVGECAFFGVEAEVDLTLAVVGAMAGEAVVGEDGADVAVEVDILFGGGGRRREIRSREGGKRDKNHSSEDAASVGQNPSSRAQIGYPAAGISPNYTAKFYRECGRLGRSRVEWRGRDDSKRRARSAPTGHSGYGRAGGFFWRPGCGEQFVPPEHDGAGDED
jgi:hypothetical protein